MNVPTSVIQFFIDIIGKLPVPVRVIVGRTLGYLVGLIPTREGKIASLQMRTFLPKGTKIPSVASIFANFGQSALEATNFKPILENIDRYIEGPSREFFQSLKDGKRPTVALTAHASNFDLLAAYVVHMGGELVTVAREARNPGLQEALAKIRENYGMTTIWRNQSSSARALVRALHAGKIVAALIDQDLKLTSMFSPFFGRPASTPVAILELAQHHKARMYTGFIVRTGLMKYKILVEEIDSSLPPAEVLRIYHERLEAVIVQYPEQWVWVHKRWRTMADGKVLSSREYINYLTHEAS